MIAPQPALVRPRILVPDVAGTVLLEDEVAERIERRQPGLIEIVGPPGSGKSTALAHLAHLYGDEPFLLLSDLPSEGTIDELRARAGNHLAIFSSPMNSAASGIARPWRLTAWTHDDCIEYLLAAHCDRCADVMRRIQADPRWRTLAGNPQLCRLVLDRLAEESGLVDAHDALHRELRNLFPTEELARAARFQSMELLFQSKTMSEATTALWNAGLRDATARNLLRHEPVQMLLAARFLADQLKGGTLDVVPRVRLPERLVHETAALVREDAATFDRLRAGLRERIVEGKHVCHALAASLLHAAGAEWSVDGEPGLDFTGAYLSGVCWPRVRLNELNLYDADLTGADFTEAKLDNLSARRARLFGAQFHGASMENFIAIEALLAEADLSFVRALRARFQLADLRGATLEGARLPRADFEGADLRGARLRRAALMYARFIATLLDEADFSGADLSFAYLIGLPLREANFAGARFYKAHILNCDMEGMVLPGADFDGAKLTRSHLTGSQIPNGHFRNADLSDTGLADIEWERADLRGADLRGCTFHMGSSRSGLVGSPLACEGSRTGFYTDEYHEQDFKSPEEIRKANLCGADLRGALIDNVDFYLVDLRGARYTSWQEDHLRRCGAILETRV